MVASSATIAEAVEAKGSWLVDFFEPFAQRWFSWHMPFIWLLNNRWTKAGNCGKIMAGIWCLPLPFYPSEWLWVTWLAKNKKQRIVVSALLRFFYEAGRNLDCFFVSCLLKGSVCLDERDYLVCGWCISVLGGRLCDTNVIQLIVSEKHASSLIRNKKLRRLN